MTHSVISLPFNSRIHLSQIHRIIRCKEIYVIEMVKEYTKLTNGSINDNHFDHFDVVISGFSGRFPESSTVEEFKENLFNGVDMINDESNRRWSKGLFNLPDRFGKIKDENVEHFDHQYFNLHKKQAECMDPQMRMILEATHEAIIDAGFNPRELRGSRTSVYIGASSSDALQYWCYDADRCNGYGVVGCSRSMLSNRVSYNFDFLGPSYTIDTACSSSLYALAHAFQDIKYGRCDAAVVGGVNLILNPGMSLQNKLLGLLGADGKCKTFDESGNGYVRSESCVVLFLQKASEARRVYSTILNVRTNNDGGKTTSITTPDGEKQNRLIRETYQEIGLSPNDVSYVEAHGTGTKLGDPQEVNSIADVFCKDRDTPLLLGAIKSNMGHAEAAAGLCSIAKILIAMECGVLPGNLHYKSPNPELHGIVDGRIKVVDCNTPWTGGVVSLNSTGFGGANAHAILKSNHIDKIITSYDTLPRLIIVSGRTREAVEMLLAEAENNRNDQEFLGFINGIYRTNIPFYYHRGYTVIEDIKAISDVVELTDSKRPIWYVYSGMGTQWGMAKDLMKLDIFQNSINRCANALRSEGVDLMDILTNFDKSTPDNLLSSILSIVAVQIAFTDLLSHLDIKPDGIIGHSLGEVCSAYADGCLTLEQTILAAYWRARSVLDSDLIPGSMAAINLTWEDAMVRLPNDIIPVCHNCKDIVTIAGPVDSVSKFLDEQKQEGIYTKEVKSSGYAFHSKYIADAAPKLMESLERIIPHPKKRSSRWISTTFPESEWSMAEQCDADYQVKNVLSPVLFYTTSQRIPKNAICIEIAPTAILKGLLKRTLGTNVINLSLMKRGHDNNLSFFLTNIGMLFTAGAQPNVPKLYSLLSYPVGRGTPMLNSKVGWDHSERFSIPRFDFGSTNSRDTLVNVNLNSEQDAYLFGHTVNNRILFPHAGYMTLAWRTLAKTKNRNFEESPVMFEDVVFHRATILSTDGTVKFNVKILNDSGNFEICDGGSLVVSGRIHVWDDGGENFSSDPIVQDNSLPVLKKEDIYKEFRLRGYDYSGLFRSLSESDAKFVSGKVQWDNNWVSFAESMLQIAFLGKTSRSIYVPTRIERAVFNPLQHMKLVQQFNENVPFYVHSSINTIKAGGFVMSGITLSLEVRRSDKQSEPLLHRYAFVPFMNDDQLLKSVAINVLVHLAIENCGGALKIKVVDVIEDRPFEKALAPTIQYMIDSEPIVASDITIVTSETAELYTPLSDSSIRVLRKHLNDGPVETNCHLVVAYDITQKCDANVALQHLRASIRDDGFILLEESVSGYDESRAATLFKKMGFTVVSKQSSASSCFILIRSRVDLSSRNMIVVFVTSKNYSYIQPLKRALANAEKANLYVYIVGAEELLGAVGFLNCIKNENGGKFARLVFVQDSNAAKFSFTKKLYAKQLENDLISNVYQNGQWGSFRHLMLNSNEGISNVENAYLSTNVQGDMSGLSWMKSNLTSQLPNNGHDVDVELCTVYYAPINVSDVMLIRGKFDDLPDDVTEEDCVFGAEYAGRDSTGKRIMAMVATKSIATTCTAQRKLMWEIPESWTMLQASTIPCAYLTVYYALIVRGKICRNESILIHAGAGDVGQAAISVALHYELNVYTTVGSQVAKVFLKQTFPQLTDANISNSFDAFEEFIMTATQGCGVNLVLSSLSGEKLKASVRCLSSNGRFLGIGKFDSPMSVPLNNSSFHSIVLDSIIESDDETIAQLVHLVGEGMKTGAVRPLPTSVFNEKQVVEAFRSVDAGSHIGKVVIKVRDEEECNRIVPQRKLIEAKPRTYFYSDKSYIIVGGLGGFGLELANWMVSRGAKKLILTSRNGIKTPYQSLMVRRWRDRGVTVVIDTNDFLTLKGTENLVRKSIQVAPVDGIFNLATLIDTTLFDEVKEEVFRVVGAAKIDGTLNLDKISRDLCPTLNYFVCFSSVAAGHGSIGVSPYGLANSAMERICENRHAAQLPAMAIQWGAIGDTGLVFDRLGFDSNNSDVAGTITQRIPSCLQILDIFMQLPYPVVSTHIVAEKYNLETTNLVDCIASILGLKDVKNVYDYATLKDFGIDSLMGIEIKQMLERNMDVVLSVKEICQLTFNKLKVMGNLVK